MLGSNQVESDKGEDIDKAGASQEEVSPTPIPDAVPLESRLVDSKTPKEDAHQPNLKKDSTIGQDKSGTQLHWSQEMKSSLKTSVKDAGDGDKEKTTSYPRLMSDPDGSLPQVLSEPDQKGTTTAAADEALRQVKSQEIDNAPPMSTALMNNNASEGNDIRQAK
jgi:hypothetical protein